MRPSQPFWVGIITRSHPQLAPTPSSVWQMPALLLRHRHHMLSCLPHQCWYSCCEAKSSAHGDNDAAVEQASAESMGGDAQPQPSDHTPLALHSAASCAEEVQQAHAGALDDQPQAPSTASPGVPSRPKLLEQNQGKHSHRPLGSFHRVKGRQLSISMPLQQKMSSCPR